MIPEGREVYRVFTALSTTRHYTTAGMQPLQVSEISEYLQVAGLRGEEKRFVLDILLRIDRGFMAHHFKKQEAKK